MCRRNAWSLTGMLLIALAGWNRPGSASDEQGSDRIRNLPKGWSITQSAVLPEQQVAEISRTLGGQIVRIANTTLSVDGQRLQVNTLACKTVEDARKVQASLLRIHRGVHVRCPREGSVVRELVGKDMRPIERAYLELGLKPPKVTYDVSFHAAPILSCDYMVWNRMYNALIAAEPSEMRIRDLARSFRFGGLVRMRNHGLGSETSTFSFEPKPRNRQRESDGDITGVSFAALPPKHGIPQVGVVAAITSEAFALTPSKRRAGKELLEATEFWPVADPGVVALARRITGQRDDPADRVAALL